MFSMASLSAAVGAEPAGSEEPSSADDGVTRCSTTAQQCPILFNEQGIRAENH